MDRENIASFRRYLVQAPATFDYRYDKVASSDLKRALFKAASVDGKYIHHFFPELKDENQDLVNQQAPSRGTADPDKDVEMTEFSSAAPVDFKWIINDSSRDPSSFDPSHPGRPCVRKFKKGEPTYRCLTCGLDETCALCQYCFNEEDHVGHQVTFTISQQDCGGVCDCGDSEAWVNNFACKYHSVEKYKNSPLPDDLYESLKTTVAVALDYVVDVFSSAHTGIQKFRGENEVRLNEMNSKLSEDIYGVTDGDTNNRYTLCLWNDQKHSFQDAFNVVIRATQKVKEFGEMVTERIDAVGRGKVVVSSDTADLMRKKALMEETGLVVTVRSSRDHFREEMCETIIDWLDDISKCCVDGNYLVTREIISEELCNPWNYGVQALRRDPDLYNNTSGLEFTHAGIMDHHAALDGPYIPDPVKRHEQERNESREEGIDEESIDPPEFWECDGLMDNREKCASPRAQYLIFFDIRLWKNLRLKLRDLYMNVLVSDSDYKMKLGHIYAQLYPQVAELYSLADREPECSIISSLSTQLFTTPSVATELARYDYFTHFLAAIYSFFTNQDIGPPQAVRSDGVISMDSRMLKNRKFGQLFHDIEYIINRNTERQLISGDVRRMQQVADFLLLFQGMSPMRRQKLKHVEYESDVWISFFNAMPYVLQLATAVTSGMADCDEKDAHMCIRAIATLIVKWSFGHFVDRLKDGEIKESIEFTTAEISFDNMSEVGDFETTRASIVSNDVKENLVSLHHPLHSFLSLMIQNYKFKNALELRNLLLPAIKDREDSLFESCADDQILIAIFDSPIRTLALLTQIQVGLWVRNGYSVRSQLHHYREITLREGAFCRDLFMVQTALVVMDPAIVFLDMLDKFGLDGSMEDDETVDRAQGLYIIEEFLRYLIGILMERTQLMGLPEKEVKRRYIMKEIIQSLAFKDKTFSDMCKNVPNNLVNEVMFEDIVYELADFKAPSGVRDYGQYKLKPEYRKYFDTHYVHFSSTKIEEAEAKRKEELQKESGKPLETIVIEPPVDKIEDGVYQNLSQFTRTLPFIKFIHGLLLMIYNNRSDNQYENVFKHLLHLLHIAAIDDVNMNTPKSESLSAFLGRPLFAPGANDSSFHSVVYLLSDMMGFEQFRECKAKVQKIISILSSKDPEILKCCVRERTDEKRSMDQAMDESEAESEFNRKKRIGKARQAEIMAKMAKQQQQFAQNNAGLDESDAEEVEGGEYKDNEWVYPESQCILCKMPDDQKSVFGIIGYSMNANVFREVPFWNSGWVYEAYGFDKNLDDEITLEDLNTGSEKWQNYRKEYNEKYKIGPGFPIINTGRNSVITSCGHGVHYHCYEQYTKNGRSRGLQFTRNTPEEIERGEFLCPLCKSINNLFLPRLWKSNRRNVDEFLGTTSTFENFYNDLFVLSSDGVLSPKLDFEGLSDTVIEEGGAHLQPHYASMLGFHNGNEDIEAPPYEMVKMVDLSLYQAMSRIFNVVIDENPAYPDCGMTDAIDVLANTVSSIEISLRGIKNPNMMGGIIIDQIPTQSLNCIRSYAELCKVWLAQLTLSRKKQYDRDCVRGSKIKLNITNDMSPFMLSGCSFRNFVKHALITAPGAGLDVVQFVKTFFMANISNVLLKLVKETIAKSDWVTDPLFFELQCKDDVDDETLGALSTLIEIIKDKLEPEDKDIGNNDSYVKVIYSLLLKSVTPFVRKCAIFVHAMCGVGYDPYDFMGFGDVAEIVKLCEFLRVPNLNEVLVEMALSDSSENKLFMEWAQASFGSLRMSQIRVEYPGVIRLLKLPYRLDEFFNLASYKMDSHLKEIPTDPAICLFCGTTAALQMATFSDDPHGECQRHMKRCGRDLGIYMLPKRSAILLLRGAQGSFVEGPYLDLHGETDDTLRRGRPQFLKNNRYDYFLRTFWEQHGLPTYIARRLDAVVDIGGWETL